jgi:hypothetical protein
VNNIGLYERFFKLFILAKEKFGIYDWVEVCLVLEEDGTEVDEEEYFQTMKDNTMMMLLFKDDIWTPYGQPAS